MKTVPNYQALFEAAPYPFLLIGPDLTLIGANPAYLIATETTPDAIIGKHIFDAFPADPMDPESTNLAEVLRSIEIATATRQPHTSPLLRYAVPKQMGHATTFAQRLWSAVHTPVLDADGAVLFVAQTAIDVTDLYRFDPSTKRYRLKQSLDAVPDIAERSRPQLHEAMTRILDAERTELQALFDKAPGFIAILSGEDHVFSMVNAAFCRLVGQRELLAMPLAQAAPELAAEFAEPLARAAESGKPVTLQGLWLQLRGPAGAARQRYVDLVFQPVLGSTDHAPTIFIQGQDVTEAHLANLALRDKVRELESAKARHTMLLKLGDRLRGLSDDPEAMMAAGSEALALFLDLPRVGYVAFEETSSQAMVVNSYTAAGRMQALPRTVEEPDEYGAGVIRDLRAGRAIVIDDMDTDPRTVGAVARNHAAIGARASLAVPVQRRDRAVGFMFAHDDNPRRWSEEDIDLMHQVADRTWEAVERARGLLALRETDRRKDEFLAMLAHELRNPLAPIGAAAQLMQLPGLDTARLRHTSEVIGRQVQHMTGLIDDLLDVSRVTRGLTSLDKAPLDVGDVVADAVEQVAPLVRARVQHLTLKPSTHDAVVLGDRKRLVQVVGNILNNAAKYTRDGGSIVLATEVTPDQVVIEVSDNGIGMDADLAKRAFELFAQAERSSDRSAGGLGLGLALVRSLVELHGGTVGCSSEGLGKGSTFRIYLPRLAHVRAPGAAAEGRREAARAAPLRILVVDDNIDAAEMLSMLLAAMGHEVLVVHGPLAALEQAPAFAPRVCLLDIGLPEMDGYELARRMRSLPGLGGAVLVAVTGYGQEEDRQKSIAAGFDHHLVKPVDLDALAAVLAGVGD